MDAADFRRIALSLEGVEEGSHMGSPDFRSEAESSLRSQRNVRDTATSCSRRRCRPTSSTSYRMSSFPLRVAGEKRSHSRSFVRGERRPAEGCFAGRVKIRVEKTARSRKRSSSDMVRHKQR